VHPVTEFLKCKSFAVAGASADRKKYGNIIFRALRDSGRDTTPIHPTAEQIEGSQAYPTLASVPQTPQAISIVTRPEVTRNIIDQAVKLGIKCIWMQPGAEDAFASQLARDAGMTVIDDGSCVLVALARDKHRPDKDNL
jgi:predicted CoA-binding protein